MDYILRIVLISFFMIGISIISTAYANERRHIHGEAILTTPYLARVSAPIHRSFRKLNHTSFQSLNHDRLSDSTVKVALKRKVQFSQRLTSEPFTTRRNPCNSASIKRLLRTSKGLNCEPNWEVKLSNTPNDTFLSSMYPASTSSDGRIFLREAWDLSTGSSNIAVGIIDTGIDYTHPDLNPNVWVNPTEIAANGIDDDGNGQIDDVHGYDFINQDNDPSDDNSHGTAIAGIIGAVGNNARGTVGINWNVKMIACKAFNSSGNGSISAIVSCLNYFVKLKRDYGINVKATNNSYGGFPASTALYNAIAATRDEGMVFVAGAGNGSTNTDVSPFYPASYDLDNIISVAATDSSGNITSFSNYGTNSVDIAAPGFGVFTTGPNNQYGTYQGTSIATPHVTGAIALILAYHPEYSFLQAMSALLSSGTVKSGLNQKCATSTILNVYQALVVTISAPPTITPITTATPTSPIQTPTVPPVGNGELDLRTAKFDITKTKLKSLFMIRCSLKALRGTTYEGLSNRPVQLVIKEVSRKSRATTKTNGEVIFKVRPPKVRSYKYKAYCVATVANPVIGEVKIVRSKVVNLSGLRR